MPNRMAKLEYSRICKAVKQLSLYEFEFTGIVANVIPVYAPSYKLDYLFVNSWILDHKSHLERVTMHVATGTTTHQDFDLFVEPIPSIAEAGVGRHLSHIQMDNLVFMTDCLVEFQVFLDGEPMVSLQYPIVVRLPQN